MKIVFRIRDALDRRTLEQQRHADEILESTWRLRVAQNPKERARLAHEQLVDMPASLRRQAT